MGAFEGASTDEDGALLGVDCAYGDPVVGALVRPDDGSATGVRARDGVASVAGTMGTVDVSDVAGRGGAEVCERDAEGDAIGDGDVGSVGPFLVSFVVLFVPPG